MEIENLEIYDFLKSCNPLNKLSDNELKEVTLSIEISYSPRGSDILVAKTQNNWLYLIRSGAVERTDNNNASGKKLAFLLPLQHLFAGHSGHCSQ